MNLGLDAFFSIFSLFLRVLSSSSTYKCSCNVKLFEKERVLKETKKRGKDAWGIFMRTLLVSSIHSSHYPEKFVILLYENSPSRAKINWHCQI